MAASGRNPYNPPVARGESSAEVPATCSLDDRRSVLDFQELLQKLLSSLRGATGAMLLEADGEAVAWRSVNNPEQLRLRGAYVAVVLRACENSAKELSLGPVGHLFLNYDGAAFLAHSVGSGYFILVEFNSSSNLSEALFRVTPFLDEVKRELEG